MEKIQVKFEDIDFKKSTFSPAKRSPGSLCVAVAKKDGVYAIRDTKDDSKTTLCFTNDEWQAFIAGVRNGEFD